VIRVGGGAGEKSEDTREGYEKRGRKRSPLKEESSFGKKNNFWWRKCFGKSERKGKKLPTQIKNLSEKKGGEKF